MQRHALLLDVDGVIVQNRSLLNRVEKNAAKFVQKCIPKTNQEHPVVLNQRLYKQHGHTLLGLRAEFDVEAEIDDFNKEVYTSDILADLKAHLTSSEFVTNTQGIDHTMATCAARKVPVYLFSNAPLTWCLPVAYRLRLSEYNVITANVDNKVMKPHAEMYDKAYEYICKESSLFCPSAIFVDDSMTNLLAVRDKQLWTPLHFAVYNQGVPNIKTIYSFNQLTAIIGYMTNGSLAI